MKKIILILILASFWGYSIAQPQKKNDFIRGNETGFFNQFRQQQFNNSKKEIKNSMNGMQRSLAWNWDTIFSYDTAGNCLARYTQTFDQNGKILHLYMDWCIASNVFAKFLRYTFLYDSSGKLSTTYNGTWQSGIYDEYNRTAYTYDGNSNLITVVNDYWTNVVWEYTTKHEYTYDTINNQITVIYYDWNVIWQKDKKWIDTYDTNNLWTNRLNYYYHYSDWVLLNQWTNIYDTNKYLVTKLVHNWNDSFQSWIYDERNNYTNDSHGNHLINIIEKWSWLYSSWSVDRKYTHTFDGNNNSLTGKKEMFYSGVWNPDDNSYSLPIYYEDSEYDVIAYRFEASFINDYSTIGLKEVENDPVLIYPNPATNTLSIDGIANDSWVSVFDLSGKLIFTKLLNTSQLDINSLAKGLYFIKLTTKDGSAVRKFIKE